MNYRELSVTKNRDDILEHLRFIPQNRYMWLLYHKKKTFEATRTVIFDWQKQRVHRELRGMFSFHLILLSKEEALIVGLYTDPPPLCYEPRGHQHPRFKLIEEIGTSPLIVLHPQGRGLLLLHPPGGEDVGGLCVSVLEDDGTIKLELEKIKEADYESLHSIGTALSQQTTFVIYNVVDEEWRLVALQHDKDTITTIYQIDGPPTTILVQDRNSQHVMVRRSPLY